MTSPILANLTREVTEARTVMAAATLLIGGIGARIQAAIDKALENGATAEELAPLQAEADALDADANALSAAVVANTPAAG